MIDVIMDGGLLTIMNNTFHNITTGAIRVVGFTSMRFQYNVFEDSGGGVGEQKFYRVAVNP